MFDCRFSIVDREPNRRGAPGVWTPNELWEMQAMMALGVEAITTDRPDILMEYLKP